MAKSPADKRRSYRAFFIVLALVVIGGGGYTAYRLLQGIDLPEAPLANVPRASSLVGYVRFGPVVQSETLRLLLSRDVIEDRLQRVRDRCHLDPATQVDDLIVFAQGQDLEALRNIGMVARGPFDFEKLRTCFRDAFAEDGLGEMRVGEIDGIPAAIPSESDQRVAFLGRRGVAIGTEPIVRDVIDVVRDGSANASADPVLSRVWDRIATGQDIVLVGHFLPAMRDALRELAGASGPARFRPFIEKIAAFGVAADVSQGLDLSLMVSMQDAAAANEVMTTLRAQIEALKTDMLVSLTPFGPVVRSIRTEVTGTDLLITVDIPRERLERLIQFATAFRSNLGGGTGAAVPGGTPGTPQPPRPTITIPSPAIAPAPAP